MTLGPRDIQALALALASVLGMVVSAPATMASDKPPVVSDLPRRPKAPVLPDLASIRAQLAAEQPPSTTDFTYAIDRVDNNPIFEASYLDDLEGAGESHKVVLGLHLTSGVIELEKLSHSVADPDVLICTSSVCTLRAPLIVQLGAGLLVRGTKTNPLVLRLSHQGGAFLGSSGLLWIEHAEVTSWDENSQTPRTSPESFRGFLLGAEGSRTVIRDTWLHDLGYDGSTAYGLSFAVGERSRAMTGFSRPTGSVFGSRIDRLFYAFYSYQAHDVQLVDNVITDSWKYGIDPHDDSLRILIAGNQVRGTRTFVVPGKPSGGHGIIVSRRVTDGWILENESHNNAESGLVVDKQSDRMVVVGNHATGNAGDGLTVYDSNKLWIAGNRFANNGDSAIRIRGSEASVLVDNQLGPHPGYCLKTTSKPDFPRPTSVHVGGNRCDPDTRLLRIENVGRLDLEVEAFGDQRNLARRQVNGPAPWRDAVVEQLRSGHAARLEDTGPQ